MLLGLFCTTKAEEFEGPYKQPGTKWSQKGLDNVWLNDTYPDVFTKFLGRYANETIVLEIDTLTGRI